MILVMLDLYLLIEDDFGTLMLLVLIYSKFKDFILTLNQILGE